MSHLDHLAPPTPSGPAAEGSGGIPLLRIQEVAATLGLTTRTIRYYEELGLLEPAGRSGGDYRQYDADDVERLRFIKGLRDDAGFSLAEIGQLLEDEAARTRNRARFRTTTDVAERRAIVDDALARVERQIASLREKADRLAAMIDEAEGRRDHLLTHIAEIEAGVEPAPHDHPAARSGRAPRTRAGR
jgi:MerR family copper efflux transcriptional regulator